jgi:hypothetical protein
LGTVHDGITSARRRREKADPFSGRSIFGRIDGESQHLQPGFRDNQSIDWIIVLCIPLLDGLEAMV